VPHPSPSFSSPGFFSPARSYWFFGVFFRTGRIRSPSSALIAGWLRLFPSRLRIPLRGQSPPFGEISSSPRHRDGRFTTDHPVLFPPGHLENFSFLNRRFTGDPRPPVPPWYAHIETHSTRSLPSRMDFPTRSPVKQYGFYLEFSRILRTVLSTKWPPNFFADSRFLQGPGRCGGVSLLFEYSVCSGSSSVAFRRSAQAFFRSRLPSF